MKLEYTLEEKDFIELQLFSTSEDDKMKKRLVKIKILMVIFFLYLGINLYNENNTNIAITLGIFAIISFIFFNKFFKYTFRKFITKTVKNSYGNRIGEKETAEFNSEYIIIKTKIGESKTKISEIEIIYETHDNFFY